MPLATHLPKKGNLVATPSRVFREGLSVALERRPAKFTRAAASVLNAAIPTSGSFNKKP